MYSYKILFIGLFLWSMNNQVWAASLIGDSVMVNFANFSSPQKVVVVTPGVEFEFASLSTFGSTSTTPRWAINIESDYITIDILRDATYGFPASFTFSDLNWDNSYFLLGVSASTTNSDIPISASFGDSWTNVIFGNDTFDWQKDDQIRLELQVSQVPLPPSFLLLGLGLTGLYFVGYKHENSKLKQ